MFGSGGRGGSYIGNLQFINGNCIDHGNCIVGHGNCVVGHLHGDCVVIVDERILSKKVGNRSCFLNDNGGFNDLLVDGLHLLDDVRLNHFPVDNGLDFMDDILVDGFLNDRSVDLGRMHRRQRGRSGVQLRLLDNLSGLFYNGSSHLSGELSVVDLSGLDFSLVERLSYLVDLSLFSFSVNDGLDHFLLYCLDLLLDYSWLLHTVCNGNNTRKID